jgi:hypothetical protein
MRFLIPLTLAGIGVISAFGQALPQGVPPITIFQPPQQPEAPKPAAQQPQAAPISTQPGRLADTKGFMMGDVPLTEMIKLIAERSPCIPTAKSRTWS